MTVRRAFPVGCLVVLAVAAATTAEAQTPEEPGTSSAGLLSGFDAQAVAGVVDFQYQYAAAGIVPYRIRGGVLESLTEASSLGNASGIAGAMPVPLLATLHAAIPTNDPITGTPIPEGVRAGLQRVDFGALPNSCKSEYPDVYDEGRDERYCGGPASSDPALGFTFGVVNGHTKSSGDPDDPHKAKSLSESRGVDVAVPGLQMTIRNAWARSTSGLNRDGLAEGRSVVEIDAVEVLNGLLRLGGIRSEAAAVTDGTKPGTSTTSSFTVSDASVAGIAVVIGRDGVTVNTEQLVPGTSVQEAAKTVSEALAAADLSIRLAPAPTATENGTQVSIQGSGIEVTHRGTSVTPADSFYRFPYVFAAANAVQESGAAFGTELEGGIAPGGGSEAVTTSWPGPSTLPRGEESGAEMVAPTALTGSKSFLDLGDPAPSPGISTDATEVAPAPGDTSVSEGRLADSPAVPGQPEVALAPAAPATARQILHPTELKVMAAALTLVAILASGVIPLRRFLL